ncbi:MAG: RagB/SusD family nutrient uptake outer membrane protein [Bacteroidales bacterium]|nr:RagB/SusD family nutrient uptake outer membrane protein [Bacteroidales bacterium]
MKSYIKLIALGGVLAGMASCTDLDTPDNIHYTEFPNNPIATSGEFNKCYYYTRNEGWFGRNFWETVAMFGDEIMGVNFAGNYFDNGRRIHCAQHKMTSSHTSGGQEGDLLSGITVTNTVIRNYGGAEGKDPIVAPLRAIRAYYHFWFMELYGDAPIMDRVFAEDEQVDRAPRADVARWIESELLDVIPDLTEENNANTYGTPNKWMAEALLAKLYINWGVYTNPITQVTGTTPNEKLDDCIYWCDQLIKSGVFEVGDGYRKKFFPDNGVHIKDFIYALPFDPYMYGNGYWGGWQPNRDCDFRSIGLASAGTWTWQPKESPSGCYVLTPECVDRFCLEGDERNEMIAVGQHYAYDPSTFARTDNALRVKSGRKNIDMVYTKDIEWADVTTFDVGPESSVPCLLQGARIYKYPPREEDYDGRWDKKGLQSNDLPIFRFADVLLTKAEAIVRGGTATEGHTPASLINEVRDCAHAPHITGTVTLQDILDERGRELVYEPWRRNDLIRFGQFEADWGWKNVANPEAKTKLENRLLPLSEGTLGTNTNWHQNPGY